MKTLWLASLNVEILQTKEGSFILFHSSFPSMDNRSFRLAAKQCSKLPWLWRCMTSSKTKCKFVYWQYINFKANYRDIWDKSGREVINLSKTHAWISKSNQQANHFVKVQFLKYLVVAWWRIQTSLSQRKKWIVRQSCGCLRGILQNEPCNSNTT